MTLLEAVESLGLIEVTAVSWIYVIRVQTSHVAVFQIAYLLPFFDPGLPEEFRVGGPRFWRDQERLLESTIPIEDQISELHRTRTVGNLALNHRTPAERAAHGLWSIRTHGGNDQERLTWMAAIIAAEGRSSSQEGSTKIRSLSSCFQPAPNRRKPPASRRRAVAIDGRRSRWVSIELLAHSIFRPVSFTEPGAWTSGWKAVVRVGSTVDQGLPAWESLASLRKPADKYLCRQPTPIVSGYLNGIEA
jgi:hypothetical protein